MNVKCCHCGATLQVPDSYAGQEGTCNHCQGAITLPELPEAKASSIWDVTPENIGAVHIDPDKPLPKPVFIPEEPAQVLLTQQQIETRAKLLGCFSLVFITGLLIVIFLAYQAARERSPQGIAEKKRAEKSKEAAAMYGTREGAQTAVQMFILRRISTPSTAYFFQRNDRVNQGKNLWSIHGSFDAENQFGATIRHNFSSTLKYKAHDQSWELISLSIQP